MSCDEFLRRLDAEGDALPAETLAHAASCPSCGRDLRRWREAGTALRALGDEPAPAFLTERVMAHVRAQRRDAAVSPARRLLPRPAALLAALALVSLAGYTLWTTSRTVEAPVQQARAEPAGEEMRDRPQDTGELRVQPPLEPPAAAPVTPPAPAAAPSWRDAGGGPPRARALPDEADAAAVASLAKRESDARKVAHRSAEPVAPVDHLAAAAPERPAAAPVKPAGADGPANGKGVRAAAMRQARGEPAVAAFESGAAPPEVVLVELAVLDGAGRQVAQLRVAERPSPPPASRWTLRVATGGGVAVAAADGRDIAAAATELAAALGAAALAPGEYALVRR